MELLALLFTIVLVSGLSVSLVDPKHYLLRYKIPIHTQVDIDPARYLCHRCNLLRQREDVKHCHECGKCVDGFDHHCYALNHCIGARNYWIMMLLFNNGLLLTTALLIAAVAFIYGVLARSRIMIPQFAQSKTDLASDKLICFGSPCLALIPLIVVIVYVIPTVLVLFSFGALVGAHWSLVAENSTTWQHFKERKSTPEKGKSLIMRQEIES
ncbi:unnamed protein product [Notodromas monacha]|uniref:Palmitoyltransferase n=1 Tax=Notodromas monacha TaxID=399045 RepID=A0A7R9BIG2_9CRUS|nr:unnamed protein product [Notodromas monacha]CAG0914718.1 unnamed protein product [Notodromas monacha]